MPAYAEQAYGDALLYMRRPEAARDAYNRVLAQTPKDVQARYAVFFAYVELDDFTAAYATIDSLVSDEPIWRYYRDDPTPQPNPERGYAETTAAQARAYGNQLGEAWDRLVRLSDAAPANANTRLALYQVANARGWPRRAQTEAEIAASLAPRDVGSRIALVETAINAYRFADAQRMVDELLALYPENQGVRRLARDLDAKRRWLLDVKVQPSNSDGGGANASGQAILSEARLYSPPIADNWRLFALGDYSNAHPPEGFVQRGRAGGGLEWRIPWLTATVYPTQSWGTLVKAGGGVAVDWWVTDQIELAGSAELFSINTPLRGAAVRHHRRRVCRQGAVPLARIAQHRRELRLSAVHRRQPAPHRRCHLHGTADQHPGLRPHRPRRGLRLEQHAGRTHALLQSQPGPVADRRPAGRARAVAALRQQPGPRARRSTPASMPSRATPTTGSARSTTSIAGASIR